MDELPPVSGVPGRFIDGQDFTAAFSQALSTLAVAELPAFHAKLAMAVDVAMRSNDPQALIALARAIVIEKRLSTNPDYRSAVNELADMDDGPAPAALDHRLVITSLRALG